MPFRLVWFLSFVVWLISTLYIAIHFAGLPDTLPIHFNHAGKADGFGPRSTLLTLPIIALVLGVLLFWVHRKPHWLNYPVKITDQNRRRQESLALGMLAGLNLLLQLCFQYLSMQTMHLSLGLSWPDWLSAAFLPLFLGLTFLILMGYLVLAFFKG